MASTLLNSKHHFHKVTQVKKNVEKLHGLLYIVKRDRPLEGISQGIINRKALSWKVLNVIAQKHVEKNRQTYVSNFTILVNIIIFT